MNYELAKQLKVAGFPQYSAMTVIPDNPTLSELIQACGDKFKKLEFRNNAWFAHENETGAGFVGLSPEEAVANLWLVLKTDS